MRYFDDFVFLGAGIFSKADVRALHRRLNDALLDISGMQQGADISEFDNREDIVRDFAAALLGKNIRLTTNCISSKCSITRNARTGDTIQWHEEMNRRRNIAKARRNHR